MNAHKTRYINSKRLCSILLLCGAVFSTANAKDKDCWVDVFDDTQYKGHHVLLTGPVQLENLTNVDGQNWTDRISSLKVGPKASVTVFDNVNFKLSSTPMAKSPALMKSWGITEKDIKEESELIFNADAKIHDLSDFNFHDKIKSLKINCH